MADSKVTALTELTAVESTDLLYVIDDPAGTPAGKKATVANAVRALGNGLAGPRMFIRDAAYYWPSGWGSMASGKSLPTETMCQPIVFSVPVTIDRIGI